MPKTNSSGLSGNSEKTLDAPSFYDPAHWAMANVNLAEMTLPHQLGNYLLLEQIGRGGMGVVFRAKDKSSDSIVAIKMLLARETLASESEISRFKKESLIQAKIEHNNIVQHIEFDTVNGVHFLVNEFVDGVNLGSICRNVANSDQRIALLIIRDVLRGLNAMHQQAIIHRDIKPSNVLVSFGSLNNEKHLKESDFQIAKLTDFGLSRQIDQSESLALTQTQTKFGTPLYMAPEQHTQSRSVGIAADIYSIGATLFHMLSGAPPFQAETSAELYEMHRDQQPHSLKNVNAMVGDSVEQIVMRALQKRPSMRYNDAGEMLADIESVLAGKPTHFHQFPTTPTTDKQPKRYSYTRNIDASPENLWPFVAETDRFNRAIGLPSPDFSIEGEKGNKKVFATANFKGQQIRWREHPFQWLLNRRLSVLREFESGPFAWVTSTILLEPMVGNRTRLMHEFQVEPRGWLGTIFTPIQFGFITKRQLQKVYGRIERLAKDSENPVVCDANLANRQHPTKQQSGRMERAVAQIKSNTTYKQQVDLLASYLKQASDRCVSRIRPIELANRFGFPTNEFVEVCMIAAGHHLLRIKWDIICPVCRTATQSIEKIGELESHYLCEICDLDIEVDIGSTVELTFQLHPEIRQLDTNIYCIGGPFHSPHTIVQTMLSPAHTQRFGMDIYTGSYHFRSPQLNHRTRIRAEEENDNCAIDWQVSKEYDDALEVGTGFVAFHLQNPSSKQVMVAFEKDEIDVERLTVTNINEDQTFAKYFHEEISALEDLRHTLNGCLLNMRMTDFESLIEETGELNVDRIWREIETILSELAGSNLVIEGSFDRKMYLIENHNRAISICEKIRAAFADKFSFVISRGNISMTGKANSPRYIGKPIRDSSSLINETARNSVFVERWLIEEDESILDWLKTRATSSSYSTATWVGQNSAFRSFEFSSNQN